MFGAVLVAVLVHVDAYEVLGGGDAEVAVPRFSAELGEGVPVEGLCRAGR